MFELMLVLVGIGGFAMMHDCIKFSRQHHAELAEESTRMIRKTDLACPVCGMDTVWCFIVVIYDPHEDSKHDLEVEPYCCFCDKKFDWTEIHRGISNEMYKFMAAMGESHGSRK